MRGGMEALPVISGRLSEINGVDAESRKEEKHFPRHLLQSVLLTWSDKLPAGAQKLPKELVVGK